LVSLFRPMSPRADMKAIDVEPTELEFSIDINSW
jgi:hypothetical protein